MRLGLPTISPENSVGGIKLLPIVFASRNKGKIREVKAILEGTGIDILTLHTYQDIPEISEDGHTFFENAFIKARTVSELTGEVALADDSGLAVDALGGAPGIYSSRYAGEAATDAENISKLLDDMRDVPADKRGAIFICILVLYYPGGNYFSFEGRWQGQVTHAPVGSDGFGYDPIFFLPDKGLTSAQLPYEEKNKISHRALAFNLLKEFLARTGVISP